MCRCLSVLENMRAASRQAHTGPFLPLSLPLPLPLPPPLPPPLPTRKIYICMYI